MQAMQRVDCGDIGASTVEITMKSGTVAELVIRTVDSKDIVFTGTPGDIRKMLKFIGNKLDMHFGKARVE